MPDQDNGNLDEGQPNEFMPGDEDFEEEHEGDEGEAAEEAQAEGGRFGRFGIRRGGGGEQEPPLGTVRGTHERVHVDDRASAVFVLICAIGLVGILIGSFVAQYVPSIGGAGPLPTLNLETFAVPSNSPTVVPSGSATASGSVAPTASPTATPAASPTAS